MKKTIRMGDLLDDRDALRERLADLIEWKNLFVVNGYHHDPIDVDEMMDWLKTYGDPLKDYICDTTEYLDRALESGKNVMFEAQLGALRDIDLRHLSLHVLFLRHRRLRPHRRGHPRQESGQRAGDHEGLLHLRRRRAVHL